MDHSHHDHSHMDHSSMDHGDMNHGSTDARCSMNMLFTWDTNNLCIVFRQWHIRSNLSLVVSLLLVVAIGAGYEALRATSRRYEASLTRRVETAPKRTQEAVSRQAHLVKSVLYALQNFYAFMLMLVFMTYNGWVMLAVSIGAFVGYYLFGASTSATKDNACH